MTGTEAADGATVPAFGGQPDPVWCPDPAVALRRPNLLPLSVVPGGLAHRYAPAGVATMVDVRQEAIDDGGLLVDVRILIVDDCTLYRDFLAAVVVSHGSAAPQIAWDRASLIESFAEAEPDVILVNMRTRDSAVLLRQVLQLNPAARMVVFGVAGDDESEIVGCAEAGVAGYHLRSESLDDLVMAVHKVAAGEFLCSPSISAILLQRLSTLAAQRQRPAKELVLTTREIQILGMLEVGLSNQEIAERLCIAVHTVKNHVHSLLTKLGVTSRAQAAALARTILPTDNSC